MGQYIKFNGESFKVGTCESLYYTTFTNMRGAANAGLLTDDGDGDAESYIKANSGYRFRFPFPEEDEISFGKCHASYDKGLFIEVLRDRLTDKLKTGYDQIIAWHNVDGNEKLKCRLKGDNPNNTEDFIKLEIVQQKNVHGLLWVVMRDPFTHNLFRVAPVDVVSLVNAIVCAYVNPETRFNRLDDESAKYFDTVCSRIMEGYNLPYEAFNSIVS